MKFIIVPVLVTLLGFGACDLKAVLEEARNWEEIETDLLNEVSPPPSVENLDPEVFLDLASKVKFYLYTTPETRDCPEEIFLNDYKRLAQTRFNSELPIKFLIHGFGQSFNCEFPQRIKNAYLDHGYNLNIIVVDWSALSMDATITNPVAAFGQYLQAANNAVIVGRRVGDMITCMNQHAVTNVNMIHLIGFGLGAHVAGYAGERVRDFCPLGILRITGLDPSGPLFLSGRYGHPLNRDDARFVDVIHTDMGRAGTTRDDAHANYFVNGGAAPQPGCNRGIGRRQFIQSIVPEVLVGTCSHRTIVDYYVQSIINRKIEASSCTNKYVVHSLCTTFRLGSLTPFGEPAILGTEGNYYLDLEPTIPEGNHPFTC